MPILGREDIANLNCKLSKQSKQEDVFKGPNFSVLDSYSFCPADRIPSVAAV